MKSFAKRHASIITTALGLLALLGGSTAAAETIQIKADVPFGFTAGKTTVNGGTYSIERVPGRQGLLLVHGPTHGIFLLAMGPTLPDAKARDPRLVFRRYGKRYFLREVWMDGTQGYLLRETPEEREWAKRLVAARAEPVTILAKVD